MNWVQCLILLVTCLLLAGILPGSSEEVTEQYDQVLESSRPSAAAYRMEADAALNSNRFERAIELARKSLKKDNNDIDTHRILAEALETKLEVQGSDNQALLRECLTEYLVVMKADVGEEKGLSLLGPGLMAYLYGNDDSTRYLLAKSRIKHLTGSLPRPWETNNIFFKRVIKQQVYGKIISQAKCDHPE